jgi:predicted hydrocarbon binding protein
MAQAVFPARILSRFVETLSAEVGHETLSAVLLKSGLPKEWSDTSHFEMLGDEQTAHFYARLQFALRKYYGRGARGILLRIGSKLWDRLLDDSAFRLKAQAGLIRRLPRSLRRKPALELLARILSAEPGDISVHTLDLDLLFVDHTSPTALEQSDAEPICFVTLGLIRECLFSLTGLEHDIEERTCRVLGAQQCEFKITIGG